jgi:exodeoxyribonuclease-1
MAKTIFWYDLETSGTQPRWDRIVQVAGFRTGLDLEPVGDEYCRYVRLPDEVLPDPDAVLVTGITPQRTHLEGVGEWQAMAEVHDLFSVPGTCVAGFNSLRFDDEFIRHAFFRALLDPYAREWRDGNSRWDIIDLVRATGALRPEGIEWPVDDEGLPVYRLEAVAAANGLEHDHAHDALSDVRATVALARLIRRHQPRLYAYYFDARFKKHPKALLEPFGENVCVHVSGMYPRARFGVAPVLSICQHPTNSNSIVVADLGADIDCLLNWPATELREALFTAGVPVRPPLKEVRINRCPFIAPFEVLTPANLARLELDEDVIARRRRALQGARAAVAAKVREVYRGARPDSAPDADAALYDGFVADEDRARCASLQQALRAGRWLDLDYRDARLGELAPRLKARNFPQWMTPEEADREHQRVRAYLHTPDAPWRTLDTFEARLAELDRGTVVSDLADHARALRAAYP